VIYQNNVTMMHKFHSEIIIYFSQFSIAFLTPLIPLPILIDSSLKIGEVNFMKK